MKESKEQISKRSYSLKTKADTLYADYQKLNKPAEDMYKQYRKADEEHKYAVMFEKAKRKVMRDLLDVAGNIGESL